MTRGTAWLIAAVLAAPVAAAAWPTAPPPEGSVRPAEFEPCDSHLLAAIDYGAEYRRTVLDLSLALAESAHVYIVASTETEETLAPYLEAGGVPPGSFTFLCYEIETPWIRDYGPEFVRDPGGDLHIVDSYRGPDRPNDDAIPLRVGASDWIAPGGGGLEAHSHVHGLRGGSITTDGAGTCFVSRSVYGMEIPAGWTEAEVDATLRDYLGCEQIVALEPICLDPGVRLDAVAKIVAPTSILLAEFPQDTRFHGQEHVDGAPLCPDPFPDDHGDMEDNLAAIAASTNLSGEPWQITRIRLPEPYEGPGRWVYRSYLNAIVAGDRVAVSAFREPRAPGETADDLAELEEAARLAYESAVEGATAVMIPVDRLADLGGGVHDIAHEIPSQDGWEPPAALCGDGEVSGSEECDCGDPGTALCEDLGLGEGLATCDWSCLLDTSDCAPAGGGEDPGEGDEDAGPAAEAGEGGGCGCTVAGARSSASLARLLLGA